MKYILANRHKAQALGLSVKDHIFHGEDVVLNEKEILFAPQLEGTFPERAEALDGEVFMSSSEIMNHIKNN